MKKSHIKQWIILIIVTLIVLFANVISYSNGILFIQLPDFQFFTDFLNSANFVILAGIFTVFLMFYMLSYNGRGKK